MRTNDVDTQMETLSVLVQYRQLKAADLALTLRVCHEICDEIVGVYTELVGVAATSRPSLEVLEIHTGNSIQFKLRFTSTWLPQISQDPNDDIVIGVPKKLAVALLLGYMLFTGVEKCVDLLNKLLEGEIKRRELILKESEIQHLMLERSGPRFQSIQRKADDLTRWMVSNSAFKHIEIDGISIKGHERD